MDREEKAALREALVNTLPPRVFRRDGSDNTDVVVVSVLRALPRPWHLCKYDEDSAEPETRVPPKCAFCGHGHTEAAWSPDDPDDGTCWSTAGALICGCPKFITPEVAAIRKSSWREGGKGWSPETGAET